jgi:hypothetical protein
VHAVVHRDLHRAAVAERDGVCADHGAGARKARHLATPAHLVDEAAEIVLQRCPEIGMAAEIGDFRDLPAGKRPAPELRIGEDCIGLLKEVRFTRVQPEEVASIVEAERQRRREGLAEIRRHGVDAGGDFGGRLLLVVEDGVGKRVAGGQREGAAVTGKGDAVDTIAGDDAGKLPFIQARSAASSRTCRPSSSRQTGRVRASSMTFPSLEMTKSLEFVLPRSKTAMGAMLNWPLPSVRSGW